MMRTYSRALAAVAVGVVVVAQGVVASAAPESSVEGLAALVAEVAPDQGAVVPGDETTVGVVAVVGEVTTSVPRDPDEPIVLEEGGGVELAVSLPLELDVADAVVADDGSIVYEDAGGGADAVAQALADGSVRIQTVTADSSGPHEFTYAFSEGVTPVVLGDGSVELVQGGARGDVVLGTVDPPWAVDATGGAVGTRWMVVGEQLVQIIDAVDEARYPVVADPSVSVGRYVYFRYSRAEQQWMVNTSAALVATTLCAPTIGVACIVGAGVGGAVQQWIASRGGICSGSKSRLEVRMTWSGHLAGVTCVK